ncbi:uncharacterized protein LOC135498460 [Lineus longissimus]|uniref:uncharacterized protein LOC135498460 n=1 Tax=Lineus longissimus TaxID=88925 RepID=UPI002B4ED4E1
MVVLDRYVDVRSPCICLHCDGTSFRKESHYSCAYVTTKGRSNMYIPKFFCTSCDAGVESKISVSDVVVNDLWPGSPSISSGMYIFEADVLRWYHYLKMESPSLSRHSFLAALEQFSRIQGNLQTISPQPRLSLQ